MGKRRAATSSKTTATAETRERWRQALELRKSGHSYLQIAAALGYAEQGAAYKAVQSALAEITREPAESVKQLELERLDGLYAIALVVAEDVAEDAKARVAAVATAVKVGERRARLLGLDAPVKTQEVPPDKLSDEQLRAELQKALAALPAKAAS